MQSKAPGSNSVTPAYDELVVIPHNVLVRGEISSRVQHVDEVSTNNGRGTVATNQRDTGELMVARKCNARIACMEWKPPRVGRRIKNQWCSAV